MFTNDKTAQRLMDVIFILLAFICGGLVSRWVTISTAVAALSP